MDVGKQLVRFLVLKVTRWMRSEPSGMTTHISRIDLWSRLARVTVQYRFITKKGEGDVQWNAFLFAWKHKTCTGRDKSFSASVM